MIGQSQEFYDDEYVACSGSPIYLCHNYCIIDDSQDGSDTGAGTMPFELWDYQVTMMDLLCEERLLILLKARQLGMSWVCCAYALWLCLFNPQKEVLVLSKGKPEAQEMVRRISSLYKRLPEWLRQRCPKLTKDNTGDLEWDNGSRVKSLAASKDAGSGFTSSLVILDEFAKMLFPESTYTAVKPAIDGGGQLVIISTAKGVGNTFHTLWQKAEKRTNKFYPFFLPWFSRPGRDQKWYDEKILEESDPDNFIQEYPATAEEAFLASGRPRFLPRWLEDHQKNIEAPRYSTKNVNHWKYLPISLQTMPDLRIYRVPEPGRQYVITTDPSQGLPSSDPSPAMVFDSGTWEQVALLYGRYDPTVLGGMVANIGWYYNQAAIVVLRMNHGHTTLAALYELTYPNVVWGPDKKPGWPENVKWKPQGVDHLAVALKDNLITIRTEEALEEARIYQVGDDGKTSAPPGKTDDLVSCLWAFTAHKNRPLVETQGFTPTATPVQYAGTTYVQSGYNSTRPAAPQVVPALGRGWSILGK